MTEDSLSDKIHLGRYNDSWNNILVLDTKQKIQEAEKELKDIFILKEVWDSEEVKKKIDEVFEKKFGGKLR